MIVGVGIDLVDVGRVEKAIIRWDDRFLVKVFLPGEVEYCKRRPFPPRHFASRFAAKEAFLKALGYGLFAGIALTDVEVFVREGGRPELRFYGRAAEVVEERRVGAANLSLSHDGNYAAALVVLEGRPA